MKVSLAEAGRSVSCARVRVASGGVGAGLDEVVGGELGGERRRRRDGRRRCWPPLSRVSKKKASSSGCRASRADSTRSMTRPPSEAVERARVVVRRSRSRRGWRRPWRPSGALAMRPVSQWPRRQLAPSPQAVGVGGEGRIGARVPGVDVDAGEIEHAAAVDGGDGVGAGEVVRRARGRRPSWKACR